MVSVCECASVLCFACLFVCIAFNDSFLCFHSLLKFSTSTATSSTIYKPFLIPRIFFGSCLNTPN